MRRWDDEKVRLRAGGLGANWLRVEGEKMEDEKLRRWEDGRSVAVGG